MSETASLSTDTKIHPVCSLFPLMTEEELGRLQMDIAENGQKSPIFRYQGQVIDGRNRLLACQRAGITPRFEEWNGKGSLVAFAWSMNGIRRHLTPSQKAAIAVEMLPLLEEEAAKRQATAGREQAARGKEGGRGKQKPLTQKVEQGVSERNEQSAAAVAAATTGTNRQYVADAKKLKEEDPEEFERLKTGETTLPQAQRKQREQKKETRRAENHRKVADVPPADIVTAGARFATIMIDPPWDWGDEGDADQLGRARPAYATMPIDQLHALPVAKLADDDCHLYLWITNRSLPKGFALLEGWGFRYITMLTWVKPYFGMGNYFRGQTEQILFGVKGNQQLLRKDAGTVFYADRGKGHSAKPKEFYPFVESCSPGPFLEMFSRSERLGWSAWGEASGSASAQF